MHSIRRALARLNTAIRGHTSADHDLRSEMEAHLQMASDEYVRRGMSPDEARRRALAESGGFTQATENVREQRGLPVIERTAMDVRYALRHFRRTPLSTITMVLVLSLGIGTTIGLFTVLNSLATMPPAGIARDEALVRLRGSLQLNASSGAQARLLSWPEIQLYAAHSELFRSVAAYADETGVVSIGDASSTITANLQYTTSNYLNVLGVTPAMGRTPAADKDELRMTASPTALVSHAFWQQYLGGASDVIGRTVRINGFPVEIAGVAPPRFNGVSSGTGMTIWLPLSTYPILQKRTPAAFSSYDSMFLGAVARLQTNVAAENAASIVGGLATRALRQNRDHARSTADASAHSDEEIGGADVVPLLAVNSRISERRDLIVSGATAIGFALLVLLITCTNVSALMVGLAVARRREIGVRLALGAARMRVIRQLLTESLLLALIAASVGLLVTTTGIHLLGTALGDMQLVVNWRVTLATCAVAIVTGILFGISPALHATRVSVGEVLKNSSSSTASTRLQRILVVAQVTLTQPLLVGLGVVIATMATDIGHRSSSPVPGKIVEVELNPWSGRVSPVELGASIRSVVDRVAAMPGVLAAIPMQMGTVGMQFTVHPADRIPGITYGVLKSQVEAAPRGYFGAFEIPIVQGRDFNASELAHTTSDPGKPMSIEAVIIGSDLAHRLWGNANPIGRRLTIALQQRSDSAPMTVVGVVSDKAAGPSEVNGVIRVYAPYSTMYSGILVRTAGPALPMVNAIRNVVSAELPQIPIVRVETMQQREDAARRNLLRTSQLVAAGGVLALLLSAVGLYAVIALIVGQRTREIGIRTALGAPGGQVVRIFFAQGITLGAIGLVCGLPLSMLATRFIARALDWPLATSPLVGAGIGLLVLLVASVSVWIPARRASRVDPLVALRSE